MSETESRVSSTSEGVKGVKGGEEGEEDKEQEQVTTTTTSTEEEQEQEQEQNGDENESSGSVEEEEDSSSFNDDSNTSNSNEPTTSSTSSSMNHITASPISSSSILRPSRFMGSGGGGGGFILAPPTIMITYAEGSNKPTPTSSFPSFIRPSKLQVKPSPVVTKEEEKGEEEEEGEGNKNPVFVPLTKEMNGENNKECSGSGTGKKEEEAKADKKDNEFLFGQNLEDRASKSVDRKRKIEDVDPSTPTATTSKVPALEDVQVCTGEEDEVNVLQVNCRLYTFDTLKGNWVERVSRGVLRLNDTDSSNSRLIVRTQGSLRLMLNTKVFDGMVVERPNERTVKFTAVDLCQEEGKESDTHLRIFLVKGSYNDMESLNNALQNRLRRFKQS